MAINYVTGSFVNSGTQFNLSSWNSSLNAGTSDDIGIVVAVLTRGSGGVVDEITYNGSALSQAGSTQVAGGTISSAIYYLTDASTGSNQLSVTFTALTQQFVIIAAAYSGMATTSALDQVGGGNGNSTTPGGSVTTTEDEELVFACTIHERHESLSVNTWDTSTTSLADNDNGAWVTSAAYEVQSSSGSITASWTATGADIWAASVATFKVSATANVVPTIVLNTSDAATLTSTPELAFTGTDADSDDIRYNVQISSNDNFSWNGDTIVETYDTGSSLTIHPNPAGVNQIDDRPGQSFMGNGGILKSIQINVSDIGAAGTYQPEGDAYIRIYEHAGTYGTSSAPVNAASYDETPTSGWIAISDAFAMDGHENGWKEFVFSGNNQIYLEDGTPYIFIVDWVPDTYTYDNTFGVRGDGANSGNNHGGNCYIDGWSENNNGVQATWDIFFILKEEHIILDKTSGTDAGFSGSPDNTDPFASGQQVTFTVQAGDALDQERTYHWRARASDPSGTNLWSDWTTSRSFTTADSTHLFVASVAVSATNTDAILSNTTSLTANASATSVTSDDSAIGITVSIVANSAATTTTSDDAILGIKYSLVADIGASGGAALLSSQAIDSMAAWWSMDETSGTRQDSTQNGYDLMPTNNPSYESGVIENAVSLTSASGHYLGTTEGNTDLFAGDRAWSIFAWVKSSGSGSDTIVSDLNTGSAISLILMMDHNFGERVPTLTIIGDGFISAGTVSSNIGTVTGWVALAAWFDPNVGTYGTAYLQINNGTIHSVAITQSPASGTNGDIYIGGNPLFGADSDASIDEVVWFSNHILSSGDRSVLYNTGSGISYTDATATTGGDWTTTPDDVVLDVSHSLSAASVSTTTTSDIVILDRLFDLINHAAAVTTTNDDVNLSGYVYQQASIVAATNIPDTADIQVGSVVDLVATSDAATATSDDSIFGQIVSISSDISSVSVTSSATIAGTTSLNASVLSGTSTTDITLDVLHSLTYSAEIASLTSDAILALYNSIAASAVSTTASSDNAILGRIQAATNDSSATSETQSATLAIVASTTATAMAATETNNAATLTISGQVSLSTSCATQTETSDNTILAQNILFSVDVSTTSQIDDIVLLGAFSIEGTMAAQTETTSAELIVVNSVQLTSTIAADTSTTDATLEQVISLTSVSASQTDTSAPELVVHGLLSISSSLESITFTDDAIFAQLIPRTGTADSISITDDGVLQIRISLSGGFTSETVTSDLAEIVVSIIERLQSNIHAATTTPDDAILDKLLQLIFAGSTATNIDEVILVIAGVQMSYANIDVLTAIAAAELTVTGVVLTERTMVVHFENRTMNADYINRTMYSVRR